MLFYAVFCTWERGRQGRGQHLKYDYHVVFYVLFWKIT